MDILSYLLGKNSAGGGGSSLYAPKYISFYSYSGADLDYETTHLDTSNITSLQYMFSGCNNITSLNLSEFDLSNVVTGSFFITSCNSLVSITGLECFKNAPKLNTLRRAFSYNSALTSITLDLENSPACDFQEIVSSDTSLQTANFSNIKPTDMSSMFSGCSSLVNVNFSNLDFSSFGGYLTNLFNGCSSLVSVDLSMFSFANSLSLRANKMFNGCTNLTHIDLRNMLFTKVTQYTDMFGSSASTGVPDNCEIIVQDDTQKTWITSKFSRLTNVKTVAEYER